MSQRPKRKAAAISPAPAPAFASEVMAFPTEVPFLVDCRKEYVVAHSKLRVLKFLCTEVTVAAPAQVQVPEGVFDGIDFEAGDIINASDRKRSVILDRKYGIFFNDVNLQKVSYDNLKQLGTWAPNPAVSSPSYIDDDSGIFTWF